MDVLARDGKSIPLGSGGESETLSTRHTQTELTGLVCEDGLCSWSPKRPRKALKAALAEQSQLELSAFAHENPAVRYLSFNCHHPVVLGCVFSVSGCANLSLLLLKEAGKTPGAPGHLHSENLSLFSLGLGRSAAPSPWH